MNIKKKHTLDCPLALVQDSSIQQALGYAQNVSLLVFVRVCGSKVLSNQPKAKQLIKEFIHCGQ
jgi:hypothetical protein